MKQIAKILVPVDFSEHSAAAQETAVEIARMFGAKIWLLHCLLLVLLSLLFLHRLLVLSTTEA